ncbi:MAG: caspase family protein [Crocinitomicaceae bacterium]|nr:caspase family protein [Crocinitomicaceae bacterium]MBK8926479.1 caspase family protein [Crocinitomicaceae bacterium]
MKNTKAIFIGCFLAASLSLHAQENKNYLVINPEGHRATIQAMVIDKDGRAITAGFDKSVKIWNTKDGVLERQIHGQIGPGSEGMIYRMAISQDNRYLATGGWFSDNNATENVGDIRLYRYGTGQQIKLLKGHFNTIRDLEFYADTYFLVSFDSDGEVRIWDCEKGESYILEDVPSDINDIELTKGRMVTSHDNGMVYLWDIVNILDGGKPKKQFKKLFDNGLTAYRVAINPQGNRIAVSSGSDVYILDDNMNMLYDFSHGEDDITAMNFSPDGTRLVVAASGVYVGNNKVTVYEEREKEWYILSSYKGHTDLIKCVDFVNNSKCVSAGGLNHEVVVWKVETKKKNSTVLYTLQGTGRPIYSVGLQNNQLAFSNDWAVTNGASPYQEVFDLTNREFLPYAPETADDSITMPITEMDGKTFVISDNWETLTIKKGKSAIGKITLDNTNGSYHKAVTFVNDQYIASGAAYGVINVYTHTGEFVTELIGHEGDMRALNVSEDGKFLISASHDQTIRLWNIADFANSKETFPAVSLFLGANHEWIMWNEEGYFASSKRGASYVGYHVNQGKNREARYYPFEQFDIKYNRPDIIMADLGFVDSSIIELYHSAYLKRLKRMGIEEDALSGTMNVPAVTIKAQNQYKGSVEILINAKDTLYALKSIQVYINDVPVYGRSGLDISDLNVQKLTKTVQVDLMNGVNKIQVSVTNNAGVESLKETITLNNTEEVESSLFIVSVGVSEYKDTMYNLDYAAKDAEDVYNLFGSSPVHKRVEKTLLVDEKVTRENLMGLKEFLAQANRDDVVLFFVAGHGVLNSTLDYYYCTYDMDFLSPEKYGISYGELESLFDGIRAIRKILVMDTCHSGEVDKDDMEQITMVDSENGDITFRSANTSTMYQEAQGLEKTNEAVKEMFNELRIGTGATVISSAGGVEFAMESDEWQNGLFTYCLLEGIKTMNADTDKNGQIMLSELQIYVNKRVAELSNGRQEPTSRFENLALDYRIW